MKRKILLLEPLGPQGSPITSHTLFGATCWAWATLEKDVSALLTAWKERAQVVYSHTFPYIWPPERLLPVLLLPKPILRPSRWSGDTGESQVCDEAKIKREAEWAKKLQKASYITQGVARSWQNGDLRANDLFQGLIQNKLRLGYGSVWLPDEFPEIFFSPWKENHVQRNSVDRVAGATVEGLLFQEKVTFYAPGFSGLWAAVWAEEAIWPDVEAAIRIIEDTGLGGERAVGRGHFRITVKEWDEFFKDSFTEGPRFVNLGHYLPLDGEARPVAYSLQQILQKAENRYKLGKPDVYVARFHAYQPGSVFEAIKKCDVYGRLLPLREVDGRKIMYHGTTIPLWGRWEE